MSVIRSVGLEMSIEVSSYSCACNYFEGKRGLVTEMCPIFLEGETIAYAHDILTCPINANAVVVSESRTSNIRLGSLEVYSFL